MNKPFRVIDPIATGANILRLRKERGLTVRDLQAYNEAKICIVASCNADRPA